MTIDFVAPDLWTIASEDQEARNHEHRMTAARIAASDITAALVRSASRTEFDNRKSLYAPRLDNICQRIANNDPTGTAILRSDLEASLDHDFELVEAARVGPGPSGDDERCPRCHGSGWVVMYDAPPNMDMPTCPECGGTGIKKGSARTAAESDTWTKDDSGASVYRSGGRKLRVAPKSDGGYSWSISNPTGSENSGSASSEEEAKKAGLSALPGPHQKGSAHTAAGEEIAECQHCGLAIHRAEGQGNRAWRHAYSGIACQDGQNVAEPKAGTQSQGPGPATPKQSASYADDPRWLDRTRYAGKCRTCGTNIPAGARAFFWPLAAKKKANPLECDKCGESSDARFQAESWDEDVMSRRMASRHAAIDSDSGWKEQGPFGYWRRELTVDGSQYAGNIYADNHWELITTTGPPVGGRTVGTSVVTQATANSVNEAKTAFDRAVAELNGGATQPRLFGSKTGATEGPWKVQVTGSGEMVWSENALRFETEAEAKAYASDLLGRWMGADMARVVPSDTPNRAPVDPGDSAVVINYRTGSRHNAACCEHCAGFEAGLAGITANLSKLATASPEWRQGFEDAWEARNRTGSFRKGAPFADYKDFADCVSKNRDKDNPEAYCGSIKHKVEDTKKSSKTAVSGTACAHCGLPVMSSDPAYDPDWGLIQFHERCYEPYRVAEEARQQQSWEDMWDRSSDYMHEAWTEMGLSREQRQASRHTTARLVHHGVSLTNVGWTDDPLIFTGKDPSGNEVRFRVTQAESDQIKKVLLSDLAVNFSGVDVEDADIVTTGAQHTAARSLAASDSIFCSRCNGTGMVRAGGVVQNCTKCKGTGIEQKTRKTINKDLGEDFLGDQPKKGASESLPLRCNECDKRFKKKIGPNTSEAKCPRCGGYDTEPDYDAGYPTGYERRGAKTADGKPPWLNDDNDAKATEPADNANAEPNEDDQPDQDTADTQSHVDPAQMQAGQPLTATYTLTGNATGSGTAEATFESFDGTTAYFTYDGGRFAVTQGPDGMWADAAGTTFDFALSGNPTQPPMNPNQPPQQTPPQQPPQPPPGQQAQQPGKQPQQQLPPKKKSTLADLGVVWATLDPAEQHEARQWLAYNPNLDATVNNKGPYGTGPTANNPYDTANNPYTDDNPYSTTTTNTATPPAAGQTTPTPSGRPMTTKPRQTPTAPAPRPAPVPDQQLQQGFS